MIWARVLVNQSALWWGGRHSASREDCFIHAFHFPSHGSRFILILAQLFLQASVPCQIFLGRVQNRVSFPAPDWPVLNHLCLLKRSYFPITRLKNSTPFALVRYSTSDIKWLVNWAMVLARLYGCVGTYCKATSVSAHVHYLTTRKGSSVHNVEGLHSLGVCQSGDRHL